MQMLPSSENKSSQSSNHMEEELNSLRASNLEKSYRGRKVVNNVSICVKPGEVVGLLGPNGAGKTTTFYIIVGLEHPDEGEVFLEDLKITELPIYLRARKGISYLPQEPSIFRKLTVEQNILAILETLNLSTQLRKEKLELLMQELDVTHVRKIPGYALSGGERRRVEIARCLAIEPKYILLDEPFAGIDPKAVIEIQNIISRLKASNIGVLITDHNVRETLAITDTAYILSEGKIFRTGTPEQLTFDEEVRNIYLGSNFKM